MTFRRIKKKAYVLAITLAVLFCSMLLLLSLGTYSQQASILGNASLQELNNQRIAQGMALTLEADLDSDPYKVPDLDSYSLPNSSVGGTLDWKKDSQFQPFQKDGISGLFSSWSASPPALGYSESGDSGSPPPPWHALAVTQMPNQKPYQTVVSTAFPYGAFAPWGSISVSGNVTGFANPSFKDKFPQAAMLPVNLAAGEDIAVSGDYLFGKVQSADGKITLPPNSGAIPLQGVAFPDPYTNTVHDQITGATGVLASLGSQLVDKTDFVTGSYLDPEGLFKLISGKEGLTAIFSLQQACSIPMPIVPSLVNGEDFDVILLHNPFPSDYKGAAKTLDFIKHIAVDLFKAVEDAVKAVVAAWKAVGDAAAGVWDDIKGVWDSITGQKKAAEREYAAAKAKYSEAKGQLQDALDDITDIFDEFKDILKQIADAVKPTPPVTVAEEKEMLTVGWAYFGLLARIAEDLGDFFTAVTSSGAGQWNELYKDLVNETRVVHFVDRNPLGGFTEDGGFTMLSTWTVPRGRSLHLGNDQHPDFVVVGDLWIQRGATLRIQGSLFVEAPEAKSTGEGDGDSGKAWNYNPTSGNISDIIPTGTIYLEPGATLIVDKILYAEGNADHGSITICSPAGLTSPLSTAVFCGGDVQLPYGTASGLTVDRMLHYVAEDLGNSSLSGLVDDFFIPVLVDLPPQLAKLDGPFHTRKCWFSDYAVSLVIIPELVEFGLQGPWPIPLPYTNCWRNIFGPLSTVYRVELNFALGENLYTHANWWPFGQGVVPVVPKVDPSVYADATLEAFESFSKDDLTPTAILNTITQHLEEVIPEFAEAVLEEAIQAILKAIIEEASGDIEDPCANQKEDESEETEDKLKKDAEEFGQEMLQKLLTKMTTMFGQILSEYRDAIAADIGKELSAQGGAAKELPGVFLYCGGELDLGSKVPDKAAGFFFAEGDITCSANQTFGSLVSRTGSITVAGDLYYYPFYSRASLWSPQKPDTYGVTTSPPSYFSELVDVFQDGVYILTPTKGSTMEVGTGSAHVLAEGYR
jgi:hypothetical protein